MDAVTKTLYIPLYGKAEVSRKGVLLHDPTAEAIWKQEGFPLTGKSRSKWLAYYMGMRAAVFDDLTRAELAAHPGATVVHLGCGLDARAERVDAALSPWFDVDLPEAIAVRKRFYRENGRYTMLAGDATRPEGWLQGIPAAPYAVIVMEGLSMYLTIEQLRGLFTAFRAHFGAGTLILDVYTKFAARASRRVNPIKSVGASIVSGLDDPHALEAEGVRLTGRHSMTPQEKIDELTGFERRFFQTVLAGKASDRIYRLYSYAF